MGSYYLMGTEFYFGEIKSSGDLFHNNVNILNTAEQYT